MTIEDAASRYCPPVPLDASLYGSVTQNGNVLTFSDPTAAETWAMPADAVMIEASGTATLDSHGQLQKATYTLSYYYGPTVVTLEVETYINIESVAVELPKNAEDFVSVTHVDAIRLIESSYRNLYAATVYSITNTENIWVEADGIILNDTVQLNAYGTGEDFQAKLINNVYYKMKSKSRDWKTSEELLFRDGVCTVTLDKKKPVEYPEITTKQFAELCHDQKVAGTVAPDYFQEAVITDLGSTYIIELTYSEEMGTMLQSSICSSMYDNPDELNDEATSYVTNEVSGYFAVDKYTGLPTAHGYKYEGCYVIDEEESLISCQVDNSIDAPCLTAYYAINEEMPPEEREGRVIPTEHIFRNKREVKLSDFFARLARCGCVIYLKKIGFSAEPSELVRLSDKDGFFAVGEVRDTDEGRVIKPIRQFDVL
jgi:hypothetical protein